MVRSLVVFCISIAVVALASAQPSPTPSHIISRIPRQPVESSAIAKIGYSKRRHILELEFVNGGCVPLSRRAGHGLSRPDVVEIKGALLRFEHQATLSFTSDSVPTKGACIREIK